MNESTTLQKPNTSKLSLPHWFPLSGLVWLLIVCAVGYFALGLGAGTWQAPSLDDPVIMHFRIPRVASALLVGAALAASGAALQALFGNPLADPGLIGTSSGASLAVVILIALGIGGIAIPLAAFLGALGATSLVLVINRIIGGGQIGLLIVGIIISSCCGAVVGILLFFSDDLTLRGAMTWLAGNLSDSGLPALRNVLPIMLVGLVLLMTLARQLDCLMLGDETAKTLGISIERTRIGIIVGAALLTGAAVSLSGIIGFIGMMVPNALTLLLGGSRRTIIWHSVWAGGVFLLMVDTVGRSIAYPIDVPVGLIAGFFGPPFFLWILWRQRRVRAG